MGEAALPFSYSAGSHPHSPDLDILHNNKGCGYLEEGGVSKT